MPADRRLSGPFRTKLGTSSEAPKVAVGHRGDTSRGIASLRGCWGQESTALGLRVCHANHAVRQQYPTEDEVSTRRDFTSWTRRQNAERACRAQPPQPGGDRGSAGRSRGQDGDPTWLTFGVFAEARPVDLGFYRTFRLNLHTRIGS